MSFVRIVRERTAGNRRVLDVLRGVNPDNTDGAVVKTVPAHPTALRRAHYGGRWTETFTSEGSADRGDRPVSRDNDGSAEAKPPGWTPPQPEPPDAEGNAVRTMVAKIRAGNASQSERDRALALLIERTL